MKRQLALQGAQPACAVTDDGHSLRSFEHRYALLQQDRQYFEESVHHHRCMASVTIFSFGLFLVVIALFTGTLSLISWQAYGALAVALVILAALRRNEHSAALKALLETQRRMHELLRETESARRDRR